MNNKAHNIIASNIKLEDSECGDSQEKENY